MDSCAIVGKIGGNCGRAGKLVDLRNELNRFCNSADVYTLVNKDKFGRFGKFGRLGKFGKFGKLGRFGKLGIFSELMKLCKFVKLIAKLGRLD